MSVVEPWSCDVGGGAIVMWCQWWSHSHVMSVVES